MHDEHRERMRERLLRDGADTLAPHETLEMLLYYSIPREDTNPTAHQLVKRFGSVSGALAADPVALCDVPGVGPKTATYLKVVNSVLRTCALEGQKTFRVYDTPEKLCSFLVPLFTGQSVEHVYLLLFDNSMSMISCEHIAEGCVNCAPANLRKMMDVIVRHNASAVVMAHNHPKGLAIPSNSDWQMTETLKNFFSMVGVKLVEHYVIAGNQCMPIMYSREHSVAALNSMTDTSSDPKI